MKEYTFRKDGDVLMVIVNKVKIVGTNYIVYTAYERISSIFNCPHSIITFFDGVPYGQIGTAPDSRMYERLPSGSEERIQAVQKAYQEEYERAYRAIFAQYPELQNIPHRKHDGQIWITEE